MVSVGMALAAGKLLDDSCHQTVRSHRAHEKDRSLGCVSTANSSSTTSGLKADIQRDCGRLELQSQSHNEKVLRLPHLPHSRTEVLSLAWGMPGRS